MTRKDFVLIAEAIRFSDVDRAAREKVAASMADSLATTNGRFDKERFIAAAMEPTGADKHQATQGN